MSKILALFALLSVAASGAAFPASADPQYLAAPESGQALVSNPPSGHWGEGEFLCIYRADKALACGIVTKADPAGAIVKLDFQNEEAPKMGDRVSKPKPGRETPPPLLKETDNIWFKAYTTRKNWIRTSLLWDIEQAFWTIGYDRAVSSHVAVGIKYDRFDTFNANATLDGQGVLLTRTFFTLPYFSGVAAQVGLGPYLLVSSGTGPRQAVTFMLEGNVSWRVQVRTWLGLGIQFGLRWIPRPNLAGFDMGTQYRTLRAAIGLDLSLRF